MNTLSEKDIVHIWEQGQNRPLWFRAMLILAHAFPDMGNAQLADLSIGRRNIYLMMLRQQMFGSSIDSFAVCPRCTASLEFSMNGESICNSVSLDTPLPSCVISLEGIDIYFRPLTSRDFAVVSSYRDPESARRVLIELCITRVEQDSVSLQPQALSQEIIFQLGEKITEIYDPLVEIHFNLDCPSCKYNWSVVFDIASFLWTEIMAQARHLLDEVHILASAYGWSEDEILKLNTSRKKYYLELVSS